MAVLLDTSIGELVIDLYIDEAPIACENFLKLCKIKYYNGCLLFSVLHNYLVQTGDPTGTGKGGISVYGLLQNNKKKKDVFDDEITKRKIDRVGLVCMAHGSLENSNRSQFFITLRGEDLDHLEGKHTIFGEIAEGLNILQKINELYCDDDGRPYQDVRIKHTHVLDDPFPDPEGLIVPLESPSREYPMDESITRRIPYEDEIEEDKQKEAELTESIRRKEAKSRAIVLEMVGDIPDAEMKPPAEVLFVCKLNAVTTDADLELIFSKYGKIKCCEIIRDQKTGDSLNYAFIEYENEESCVRAYEKMNNVLIDDRRIKVDFSQSVSKLWNKFAQRPRKNEVGHKGIDAESVDQKHGSISRDARNRNDDKMDDANNMRYRDQQHDNSRRSRDRHDRSRDKRDRSRDKRDRSRDKRDRSRDRPKRHDDDYHRDVKRSDDDKGRDRRRSTSRDRRSRSKDRRRSRSRDRRRSRSRDRRRSRSRDRRSRERDRR